MPEIYERTERSAKKLARTAKIGDVFYAIADVAQNIAPYEDRQLWSQYKVTFLSPVTGHPMISGSLSVEGLVLRFGPVYTERPSGIRGIHEPSPQVAGPLPKGYEAKLDEPEIKGLEKRVRGGSNPRTRRPAGAWRP